MTLQTKTLLKNVRRRNFFNSKKVTEKFLPEAKQNSENGCKIMIIGNKLDATVEKGRQVKRVSAKDLAKANNLLFYETSALDGTNIEEAFRILIEEIYGKERISEDERTEAQGGSDSPIVEDIGCFQPMLACFNPFSFFGGNVEPTENTPLYKK
jgi:hypothetical protein